MHKFARNLGLGLLALTVTSPAFAAVDVSAASAGFTDVASGIGTVGPLMLAAAAAGIVYKWVTAFLI